jgi:hypothetical protein
MKQGTAARRPADDVSNGEDDRPYDENTDHLGGARIRRFHLSPLTRKKHTNKNMDARKRWRCKGVSIKIRACIQVKSPAQASLFDFDLLPARDERGRQSRRPLVISNSTSQWQTM